MTIRKILNKLISRVGVATIIACTAKEHQKLIHYIERLRRKQKNAKERNKFSASQGDLNSRFISKTDGVIPEEESEASGDESDANDDHLEVQANQDAEEDSEDSDSDNSD